MGNSGIIHLPGFEEKEKATAAVPQHRGGLGKVEVLARVTLNGKDLGTLWKPPFQVDLSRAAKAGVNTLEIEVTDPWVN